MYALFFFISLLTQGSQNSLDPIFINQASEEEILAYPILSYLEALSIIKERRKRPFRDVKDFERRVPLSILTKRFLLPLLNFSKEKNRVLHLKIYSWVYFTSGGKLKKGASFYAKRGNLKGNFYIKDSIIETRGKVDLKNFIGEVGNLLPGPVAYLIGERGYTGPLRGEIHKGSVRSFFVSKRGKGEGLTLGLCNYHKGFLGFSEIRYQIKGVDLNLWSIKNSYFAALLMGKLKKPFPVEIAYVPRTTPALWIRFRKWDRNSGASFALGREGEKYLFRGYWRLNLDGFKTISSTYVGGNVCSFKQRFQWDSLSVPVDISIYSYDVDRERNYTVGVKFFLSLKPIFVSPFMMFNLSLSEEREWGSSTGVVFLLGPFLIEELVTGGTLSESYPLVYIPGAKFRENSYIQGIYLRDSKKGFYLSLTRTRGYKIFFWAIHSGLKIKF